MGQFSIVHLVLFLIIVLLFFGPSRLPALGQSFGKAIKGFKDGLDNQDQPDKQNPQLSENSDIIKQSTRDNTKSKS